MMYKDVNYNILKIGDVIDIHQTVNGCSLFIIVDINPIDIRYMYDIKRKYEYDLESLLEPFVYTGETEYEIINHMDF